MDGCAAASPATGGDRDDHSMWPRLTGMATTGSGCLLADRKYYKANCKGPA